MGLGHSFKRVFKSTKKQLSHVFSKSSARHAFRRVFGEHTGKRVWNWVTNPVRAAQRSHRFGHSLAPSRSDKNLVTQAYNKVMSSFSKSAMKAAQRQLADQLGNSASTASHSAISTIRPNVSQHLDYSYRRLSDIS